jgi:hypothetical protein
MPQRAERVFDIDPDIPHVFCMSCNSVMVALIKPKKVSSAIVSLLIPTKECEDVGVKIGVPFTSEWMHTNAHYGFVTECPLCRLKEKYESNQLIFYNGIMVCPEHFMSTSH